jgi:hypothetical protein
MFYGLFPQRCYMLAVQESGDEPEIQHPRTTTFRDRSSIWLSSDAILDPELGSLEWKDSLRTLAGNQCNNIYKDVINNKNQDSVAPFGYWNFINSLSPKFQRKLPQSWVRTVIKNELGTTDNDIILSDMRMKVFSSFLFICRRIENEQQLNDRPYMLSWKNLVRLFHYPHYIMSISSIDSYLN